MDQIWEGVYFSEAVGEERKKISEKTLVRRCLSGEESAWRELYDAYHALVRKVVGNPAFGFDRDTQEDLLQETFIQIVKALKQFRFESNLSTFIRKIAKNICASELRRQLSKKRGSRPIFHTQLDCVADTKKKGPESELETVLEKGRLEKALSRLDERCRRLLRYFYIEECSYKEITKIMEMSLSNVGTSLSRCLAKLRRVYFEIVEGCCEVV